MRVDYDKNLLSSLIKKAGGDLRLVERALGQASLDKNSPYVTGPDVEAAMQKLQREAETAAARRPDVTAED